MQISATLKAANSRKFSAKATASTPRIFPIPLFRHGYGHQQTIKRQKGCHRSFGLRCRSRRKNPYPPAGTLKRLNRSVANLKKGKVSPPAACSKSSAAPTLSASSATRLHHLPFWRVLRESRSGLLLVSWLTHTPCSKIRDQRVFSRGSHEGGKNLFL